MASKTAREIMSDDCTCIGEDERVLDAARRLVGIVAQADVARNLDESQVGELVETISR